MCHVVCHVTIPFNIWQCAHNNVNQSRAHPPQCKLSAWHFPLLSVIMHANYFPIMITQWGGSYQIKVCPPKKITRWLIFSLFIVIVMAALKDYGVCTDMAFFPKFLFLLFLSLTVVPQARLLSITVTTDFAHCGRVNPVTGYVASVYGEDDCLPARPHGF